MVVLGEGGEAGLHGEEGSGVDEATGVGAEGGDEGDGIAAAEGGEVVWVEGVASVGHGGEMLAGAAWDADEEEARTLGVGFADPVEEAGAELAGEEEFAEVDMGVIGGWEGFEFGFGDAAIEDDLGEGSRLGLFDFDGLQDALHAGFGTEGDEEFDDVARALKERPAAGKNALLVWAFGGRANEGVDEGHELFRYRRVGAKVFWFFFAKKNCLPSAFSPQIDTPQGRGDTPRQFVDECLCRRPRLSFRDRAANRWGWGAT